jgi:hypothetical protein
VRLDTMIKKLDALEYKKFMNNCWLLKKGE